MLAKLQFACFVLSAAALLWWPSSVGAQDAPPSARQECHPDRLYRGDTLIVELAPRHAGLQFAVWTEDLTTLLVSFRPAPADKIAPVISPDAFAKMNEVKLTTTEPRGSPVRPWIEGPLVVGLPRRIFSRTGLYEVLLDGDLGYDDADFAACWIKYFDYPRPKPGTARDRHRSGSLTPPDTTLAAGTSGGAIDVSSKSMSVAEQRGFRRAARDAGAEVVDQGDHFHVQLPP